MSREGGAAASGESQWLSLAPAPSTQIRAFYKKIVDKSIILIAMLSSFIRAEKDYLVLVKSECFFLCCLCTARLAVTFKLL